MIEIINVADLTDPNDPQRRTYREVNREKVHKIPLGTLVELETGERLFVKQHTRDCDMSPLYSIGVGDHDGSLFGTVHGYDEESLTVVQPAQRTIPE